LSFEFRVKAKTKKPKNSKLETGEVEMAKAKLAWTAVDGSSQSYPLPVNFTWDYQELAQDETDRERALDGTLRSYARPLKRRWVLKFQYISVSQKEQLAAIKEAQVDVDFHRDAAGPKTFTGAWTNDLDFREVAPDLWSGSMVLEEV
jgi:hypothetical protein